MMKKLVTLMLAISLVGTEAQAAQSPSSSSPRKGITKKSKKRRSKNSSHRKPSSGSSGHRNQDDDQAEPKANVQDQLISQTAGFLGLVTVGLAWFAARDTGLFGSAAQWVNKFLNAVLKNEKTTENAVNDLVTDLSGAVQKNGTRLINGALDSLITDETRIALRANGVKKGSDRRAAALESLQEAFSTEYGTYVDGAQAYVRGQRPANEAKGLKALLGRTATSTLN